LNDFWFECVVLWKNSVCLLYITAHRWRSVYQHFCVAWCIYRSRWRQFLRRSSVTRRSTVYCRLVWTLY